VAARAASTSASKRFSLSNLLGDNHNAKQVEFILAPEFEVCFVGGMGGGKSYAACVAALRHGARFPGARILMARSTEDEMFKNPKPLFFEIVRNKGLMNDFERPRNWDYQEKTNYARMKNGSEFFFSGLYGTGGVATALGRFKNVEYSLIFVDQLEELDAYFELYELLLQRCRYSAAPPEERHVLTVANDEGDNWIRRRFLTYEPPHGKSADPLAQRKLVRTISWDNPHLDEGARAQLRQLPLEAQQRYVFATMDAGTSRLIPNFEVVEPVEIPRHWPRWCGIDPARSSGVTCALWITANPDKEALGPIKPNALHFYQEYWWEGRDAEGHAEQIMRLCLPNRMRGLIMDHTAWHESARSRKYGSITVADFYIRAGLAVSPSTGDEWTRIQLYTAASRRGLTVSRLCKHLIGQAPEYRIRGQYGPSGPLKIMAKSKFHAVDAGGYALSVIPTRIVAVDLRGPQPLFEIKTEDPVSKKHWEQMLRELPEPRESAVTRGLDESEFHEESREREPDDSLRSEEEALY
jgi:hypothetical protein